jgi:hypothetical membrane protein
LSGIAGPIVLLATDNIAAFIDPDYDPTLLAISDLALGPMGWLLRTGFLLFGLLLITEALGLYFAIGKRQGFGKALIIGNALLFAIGVGFLLMATFTTDPRGAPHTLHGLVHINTAFIVALLFPALCFFIAISLKNEPQLRRLYIYTLVTAISAIILDIGHLMLSSDWVWSGLYERIMLWNALIWLEIIAIHFWRAIRLKRQQQMLKSIDN